MTEPSSVLYVARVDIPLDHPCFPGHFPGQPILPGVLLLERVMALAQTSLARPLDACKLHNIKFLAAVAPGDVLDVQLASTNSNEYKFAVRISQAAGAEGVLACSGQLRIASS
jgi:3-hydroxymyristoyl/3-hydroxydecanoyl-(acyl carrier protein) dehydratase